MSDYKVTGEKTHRFEIWVTTDTPTDAIRLARESIMEGTRPEGVTDFWDEEGSLDLDVVVDF